MVVFDHDTKHRIMVCVTPQKSCQRLIAKGAAKAKEISGQFVVIYVNSKKELNRELKEEKVLLELFEKAKELGGTVSIISGEKVYDTLANFAKENKIDHIIVGSSPKKSLDAQKYGAIIDRLIKAVEKNNIIVEVVD